MEENHKNTFFKYSVKTSSKDEFIDITQLARQSVSESNILNGTVTVFCPHTTAGITINENADPDVTRDILVNMRKLIPDTGDYRHCEGNSSAHIKSSLFGSSCNVIVDNGELVLGTWQSVYFCEFDGPRNRKVYIKIIEG